MTATSYVTCDSSASVGRKSQCAATSRRKGTRSSAPANIVPPPTTHRKAAHLSLNHHPRSNKLFQVRVPHPSARPPFPSPSSGSFIIYPLKYCPPQVSVCYGCTGSLKPGGEISVSPFDLVVVSYVMRSYYHAGSGQIKSKASNVYFHCNTQLPL